MHTHTAIFAALAALSLRSLHVAVRVIQQLKQQRQRLRHAQKHGTASLHFHMLPQHQWMLGGSTFWRDSSPE